MWKSGGIVEKWWNCGKVVELWKSGGITLYRCYFFMQLCYRGDNVIASYKAF